MKQIIGDVMIEKEKVIELIKKGLSDNDIALKLDCGRTTVWRIRNETKNETNTENETNVSKVVSKLENETKQNETKDNTIIEEIMTEIPIYTEKEEVPKGCLEWKRKFTTDTYYPPGTVKHYIAWGTAGIEKEEGLRLLKLWNKEHKDVLPEMKTKTVKIENKPLPNYPDKDIHETHDLIKRGSDWIWIEK